MPRTQIAIASAATWPSLQLRVATPRTKASICASSKTPAFAFGANDLLRAHRRVGLRVRGQFTRCMRGAATGATVPCALT